jgi:hypothetical protein
MSDETRSRIIEERRCENCGDLKREHRKPAPFRCATRLKESYYKPWTREALDAAIAEGASKAAPVPVSLRAVELFARTLRAVREQAAEERERDNDATQ